MSIEFKISEGLVDYNQAVEFMEKRVAAIYEGRERDMVWFLQHPPIYTAGTSAKSADVLSDDIPIVKVSRGGENTYHGPGQLVAYVMLNLANEKDLHQYVRNLEGWIMRSLADIGQKSFTRKGRVGVWVDTPRGEEKIAAIGIRVRKWVSFHGVAININPNMQHFDGIVPCGIADFGVTSLEKQGLNTNLTDMIYSMSKNFWIKS